MASFFDAVLGTTVHAPDGTEREAMAALTPYHEEVRRRDMMVRGLSGIGQAVVPPPSYDRVRISPAAAMAMGPQGVQQMYARDAVREDSFNQRQTEAARMSLAERTKLMEATEREKDRSAQLAYQKMTLDNQDKERALRERQLALAEQSQNNENARAEQAKLDAQKPKVAVQEQLGGYTVTNPDGTVTFNAIPEMQEMIRARQAAYRGGGGGSAPTLLGVDNTGAKIYAHGGRTYAVLPDGNMEFRDATPNERNAQLVYERNEYGEATGNVHVVRTAPDGSQYLELLPKGPPNAPPAAPTPVQNVYPQAYQTVRELAASGDPTAVARLQDLDARLADGRARIIGAPQPQEPLPSAPAAQAVPKTEDTGPVFPIPPALLPTPVIGATPKAGLPGLSGEEIVAMQRRRNEQDAILGLTGKTPTVPQQGQVIGRTGQIVEPRTTDSYGNPSAPRYLEPEDADMPSRFRKNVVPTPSMQKPASRPAQVMDAGGRKEGDTWVEGDIRYTYTNGVIRAKRVK